MKLLKPINRYLSRNGSTLLTLFSIAGLVATTVTAVRVTQKVTYKLQCADEEKCEALTVVETIKIAAPYYVPSVLIGLSTISCIVGSNMLSKRNQASLASAYGLLNESYRRYRRTANKVFGHGADSKIMAEMAKNSDVAVIGVWGPDGGRIYDPDIERDAEKLLFYENISPEHKGRYFEASMIQVMNAIYHTNRNLILGAQSTVNMLYEFLGICNVDGGDNLGWGDEFFTSGYCWVDFSIDKVDDMEDGMECYILSTVYTPEHFDYDLEDR